MEKEEAQGQGWSKRQRFFFAFWGSVALGLALLFREVLLPFLLAVVVAYVLAPVVQSAEKLRIRGKEIPRWGIVLVVYAILLGGLAGFGTVAVPRIGVELQRLAQDIPRSIVQARSKWLPAIESQLRTTMARYEKEDAEKSGAEEEPIPEPEPIDKPDELTDLPPPGPSTIRIQNSAHGFEIVLPDAGLEVHRNGDGYLIGGSRADKETRGDIVTTMVESAKHLTSDTQKLAVTVLKTLQQWVGRVVRGFFMFFIVLMLSAYLLVTSDAIYGFFRGMARRRRSFDALMMRIDRGLSGVVRGQLLIALVNGLLTGIGFYFMELKYWPILTLIATLFSIIPIFGAVISSVPAILVALQDGFATGALVVGWILLIHQVEANFLNPKIMGDAAKVHPVLVVFALLAGEHLFGIAGALLAVPVLSITQSLFLHHYDSFRDPAPK